MNTSHTKEIDSSPTSRGKDNAQPPNLLNLIPTLVAYIDKKHCYRYVNTAYENWIGINADALIGKPVAEVIGKDRFLNAKPHLDLVLSGVASSYESRFYNKDGLRQLEIHITPDFDENKEVQGYAVHISDITGKKKIETDLGNHVEAAVVKSVVEEHTIERAVELAKQTEAIKRNEERHHRMTDEIQDYAIILLSTEGIIENWNKGAQKIKGYEAKEILGKSFKIFYTSEDQENQLPEKLLKEAVQNGRAEHEGWRVKKDGSLFWGSIVITALHDDNNQLIGFSKITRDLSERKIAEDQLRALAEELKQKNENLRQSEQRFQRMIAEVQDYAILSLNEGGEITNWNTGAQLIKGYAASEVIGKNFRIFYPKEDQENKLPETLLARARNQGKAIHEGWRVRKGGTKFWGSVVITALHNDQHEIIGFSKVTRDLTERKAAEEALKEKNIELERRNEELSEFAYISSHDLQEPLRKIQTFTTRILESESSRLSEKGKDFFARIQSAAVRMRRLIDDLLTYSRTNTLENTFVTTDLNKVISEVSSELSESIEEKKFTIEYTFLPLLKTIPFQFHQLIVNIFTNALKFSKKDVPPHMIIKAVIIKGDQIPNVRADAQKLYHHLSFTDNGIGFEPEYNTKVFEVFQRLHGRSEYEGTGIGLAICKKIADNHGGFITAEGHIDEGATFHVYLPV